MAEVRATRVVAEALSSEKDTRLTRVVAETLDATSKDFRATRYVVEALSIQYFGRADGQATVTGTLSAEFPPRSAPAGVATVTGTLDAFTQGELTGTIAGGSSVTLYGPAESAQTSALFGSQKASEVRSPQTNFLIASKADSITESAQTSFLIASKATGVVESAQTQFLLAYIYINAIEASSGGGATVVGDLLVFEPGQLDGRSDGSSSVTAAEIFVPKDMSATIAGTSTVLGITQIGSVFGPIPYQVGFGGKGADEVSTPVSASSTVTGTLSIENQLSATVNGSALVEALRPKAEHYWTFDETPGETFFYDTGWSPTKKALTIAGNPDLSLTGYSGTALNPTPTDYAFTTDTFWRYPTQVSMAMWVYGLNLAAGGTQTLVDTANQMAGSHYSWYVLNGSLVFSWLDGPNPVQTVTYTGFSAYEATWAHVAIVFDSVGSKTVTMYINGQAVAQSIAEYQIDTFAPAPQMRIGETYRGDEDWEWQGYLDEFAFELDAWSPAKVYSLSTQSTGQFENIGVIDVGQTADGSSTVTGTLQVLVDLGGGVLSHELAGASAGVATVNLFGFITNSDNQPPVPILGDGYLYLQVNSGFGFGDIDDASARSDFVSQTYPDGVTEVDFDRYLYSQVNVGFGFEDIDDASLLFGFVSQTYPDGHTELDFDRYLYQQVQVIDGGPDQLGKLIVYPGRYDRKPFIPSSRPPSGKLT